MYTRVDTTDKAKPGGTYNSVLATDVVTLDPLSAATFNTLDIVAAFTYPKMLQFSLSKYPKLSKGEVEGQLAESYELSADHLTLTFKVRPGMRWDSRAPTNGREIDSSDVVFSWNKYAQVSPLRGDFVYSSSNPSAPVESVSAPDSRTVVFKLHHPDASIVQLFATSVLFYNMPKESDGGFDPKGTVRGYGPYVLEDYRPSTQFLWAKSPNYYVKNRPFMDKISLPIVPEYATRLSQFKAGNVWTPVHRQEDILPTKKDLPVLNLLQGADFPKTPWFLSFGYEGNSPFKDERMRQAVSLIFDKETIIDITSNRPAFESQGLPIPVRYMATIGPGWEGYWIDPQDEKKFGANSKYYKYDVPEAKKLMAAAGYTGSEVALYYNQGQQYGTQYLQVGEALAGMFNDGGLKTKSDPREYQNDWLPNFYYGYAAGNKGFTGVKWMAERTYPTVASQLFATLHKDGPRFVGMTPTGNNAQQGDPKVNADVEKIRNEFDLEKQQALVHDLLRYMAGKAYYIPVQFPVGTPGFSLYWPCVSNLGAYVGFAGSNTAAETGLHLWIDTTKPPLGPG
ncbi:MAG TPA: ABC transporter substrate-binding protein [Dehalococcoidia bacterium]|nr:ABC transporter substrate-binding protein [Dehalococcoidia bacterium]